MIWKLIETAPKPAEWLRQPPCARWLLARFYTPVDEDGAAGETELTWSHVAYLTASGWMLPMRGIAGMHGDASLRLGEATHWMMLPEFDEPRP